MIKAMEGKIRNSSEVDTKKEKDFIMKAWVNIKDFAWRNKNENVWKGKQCFGNIHEWVKKGCNESCGAIVVRLTSMSVGRFAL